MLKPIHDNRNRWLMLVENPQNEFLERGVLGIHLSHRMRARIHCAVQALQLMAHNYDGRGLLEWSILPEEDFVLYEGAVVLLPEIFSHVGEGDEPFFLERLPGGAPAMPEDFSCWFTLEMLGTAFDEGLQLKLHAGSEEAGFVTESEPFVII